MRSGRRRHKITLLRPVSNTSAPGQATPASLIQRGQGAKGTGPASTSA